MGGKLDSLDKAIDIAQTYESTKTQLAQMQGARQEARNSGKIRVITSKKATRKGPEPACQRCSKQHERKTEACPAHQQKCNASGRVGYWALMRRSKPQRTSIKEGRSKKTYAIRQHHDKHHSQHASVHALSAESQTEQFRTLTFECVHLDSVDAEQKQENSQILTTVDLLLDNIPTNTRTR